MLLSPAYHAAIQSVWGALLTECQCALDPKMVRFETRVTMRTKRESRFALSNACGGGEVVVRRDGIEAAGSALFSGVATETVHLRLHSPAALSSLTD